MKTKVDMFDVQVDTLSMDETLAKIVRAIKNHEQIEHVGINSSKVVQMQEDPELKKIVQQASMISIDGFSMVKAINWVYGIHPERVTGIDMMVKLLKIAEDNGFSVYFLGTKQVILDRMLENIHQQYPNLKVAGARNGYFKREDEDEIIEDINASQADILFVGITSPFKEYFINRHKQALTPSLLMGVGGSFDVISGEIDRAPEFMQKHGLEWLFRFSKEPKRLFKRYTVDNMQFMRLLIEQKNKQRKLKDLEK